MEMDFIEAEVCDLAIYQRLEMYIQTSLNDAIPLFKSVLVHLGVRSHPRLDSPKS